MQASEYIGLRRAAEHSGRSHQTIKNWCVRYEIGELRGGKWCISRAGLDRVLKAKLFLATPAAASGEAAQ